MSAYEIGGFIGSFAPSFLLIFIFNKIFNRWIDGWRLYSISGICSIILATIIGGFGAADGGEPKFAYAFAQYAPSVLILTVFLGWRASNKVKVEPPQEIIKDNEPRSKNGWLIALLIGVSMPVAGMLSKELKNRFERSESNVGRMIDNEIGQSEMAKSFQKYYPEDWQKFRSEMISLISERDAKPDDISIRAYNFTNSFMKRKIEYIQRAPDEYVIAAMRADGRFIRKLQSQDVRLCAIHAMSRLPPGTKLAPDALSLLSDSVAGRIEAASMGERYPFERPKLSDKDGEDLVLQMLMIGESNDDVKALFGDEISKKPHSVQCSATVKIYDALEKMPPNQAARIYASTIIEAARN